MKKYTKKLPVIRRVVNELTSLRHDKGVLQLEKGLLEADVRLLKEHIANPRTYLAHRFLKGSGIEIGAAQLPVQLPKHAKVKYVDIFTSEELRKAWPRDYTKLDVVEVDVVDDGEKLTKFKDGSLDFVIANHFIEHCLDPIGTTINAYNKLRKNGILFFAIPDKRYTFDSTRLITSYDHLVEEHNDTSKKFLWEHTEDFVRLGDKYKGDIKARAQELIDSGYRVHYHVWTQPKMTEMFSRATEDYRLNLEIIAQVKDNHEVIYLLQKTTA